MPIVVHGIELNIPRIQKFRNVNQRDSGYGRQNKQARAEFLNQARTQTETERQSCKRETRPRENREQPSLGSAEIVHAVDVGFELPGEKAGTPSSPEERSK